MESKGKKSNFLPNGLIKDESVKSLTQNYLEKASRNLDLMNIINQLKTNRGVQEALKLPADYSNDEWVIITAYYAMYSSALALISSIGYKSKVHAATIWAINRFFVEKGIIGSEYLAMINHAQNQIDSDDVKTLLKVKEDREIAQYNVTKATTSSIAEASMKNAYSFVKKARNIIESIGK